MSSIVQIKTVHADGVDVFYREAGALEAPVILLLHGFPSSSHQYRNFIPTLAGKYRVIVRFFLCNIYS
jgi:pimeloyl-ACP methyl ester carboxylesterase